MPALRRDRRRGRVPAVVRDAGHRRVRASRGGSIPCRMKSSRIAARRRSPALSRHWPRCWSSRPCRRSPACSCAAPTVVAVYAGAAVDDGLLPPDRARVPARDALPAAPTAGADGWPANARLSCRRTAARVWLAADRARWRGMRRSASIGLSVRPAGRLQPGRSRDHESRARVRRPTASIRTTSSIRRCTSTRCSRGKALGSLAGRLVGHLRLARRLRARVLRRSDLRSFWPAAR